MKLFLFLALVGGCIFLHSVSAVNEDIRQNILVNGTKYKYQSFVDMGNGKYIPLFGMGLMIMPEGTIPTGLIGSAAAIFSSGYQAKAKLGETGPQEVLVAKHVRKSLGSGGSRIASQIVDKSKLKAPLKDS